MNSPRLGHHHWFFLFLLVSLVMFWSPLRRLTDFALTEEQYSHIFLIPFLSAFLVFQERRTVFSNVSFNPPLGILFLVSASLVYFLHQLLRNSLTENDSLSLLMMALVLTWQGSFAACYGSRAVRAGLFPVLFLFLTVPIPDFLLSNTIRFLQMGSAEISALFFRLSGVPVFRQETLFVFPSLAIDVAPECSGIRSSIALFITVLLAGHLFLRSPWSKLTLVSLVIPLALFKNGLRIATLTLLTIYTGSDFLSGDLHKRGGAVFFMMTLVVAWGFLRALLKLQSRAGHAATVEMKPSAQKGETG